MRALATLGPSPLALCFLLLAATAAAAAPLDCPAAETEPTEQARQLFDDALKLEASAPQDALSRLECAATLADRPAIQLRIGVISERLAAYSRAALAYRRYLELAGDAAPDRAAMSARVAELELRLEETRAADARAVNRRIAGWAVAAGGAAVAIAGAVLLGVAKAQNDAVHAVAPGTVAYDTAEVRGRIDRAQIEQGAGIGGVVIGVVLAGTGLALALAPPPRSNATSISFALSPAAATLRVSF